MKVLHLSTSDIEGGAARAAYRLHKGLQSISVDSQMLARAKRSGDTSVRAKRDILTKLGPLTNGLPLKPYKNRQPNLFSSQWFIDSLSYSIGQLEPDIVNLHWVCDGFLQVESLSKIKQPIFWTLQDMWAFTGGCHYVGDCHRYKEQCGNCPQLKSKKQKDLSNWIWRRKSKSWQHLNLTIVAPSNWIASCAKSSSIFHGLRVEVIPFGLDTSRYKPVNKRLSREILDLPVDKQLILFGALSATKDKRKGFHLLISALKSFITIQYKDNVELVVFGVSAPEYAINLGFKINYLGHLNDDISLAIAYSAADVMIVPSIQESFGQTASESLSCGTPVVAFNTTGLKDIVEHQQNGYLAQPYEAEDLARGIVWVLEDESRQRKLSNKARVKAEREFSLELQAKRYLSLYEEIIGVSTGQ